MSKGKIGLLPFYLKLYDDVCDPERNSQVKGFAELIGKEYEKRGLEVIMPPVCRTAAEFRSAIAAFEQAGVEAVITLHLAYSPSLESIEAVAATRLPLIILDTTPDYEFGFTQSKDRIMFNHGIHGVQDFCNLLLRRGKKFILEAGHWQKSDVIDRTIAALWGCRVAKAMRSSRVGIIGNPFAGMGDFAVPFATLKANIGMKVISATSEEIARLMPKPDSPEVRNELEKDLKRFDKGDFSENALLLSETAGLGVRRWLENENLSALTVNFLDIKGMPGLPVVPFLEASKAMSRGIGYAGEGDVLTAVLCGALVQTLLETTFTEMFCPDWKGNRIFLSHMGELNPELCLGKAVLQEKPFPYTDAGNPVVATTCLKSGAAHLINLAPGPNETYTLIVA
ncbi:MAG: hypothetical protein WC082_05970, partial [Victivallales bacterium]